MNSVFNLSTNNLNFLNDAELVDYLHTEGFSTLPPIVKVLAERLEARVESRLEENKNFCQFIGDVKAFNKKYEAAADKISEVVSEYPDKPLEVLDSLQFDVAVLPGDLHVPDDEMPEEEKRPDDVLVISRRNFDEFSRRMRDALESITGNGDGYFAVNDYLPEAVDPDEYLDY